MVKSVSLLSWNKYCNASSLSSYSSTSGPGVIRSSKIKFVVILWLHVICFKYIHKEWTRRLVVVDQNFVLLTDLTLISCIVFHYVHLSSKKKNQLPIMSYRILCCILERICSIWFTSREHLIMFTTVEKLWSGAVVSKSVLHKNWYWGFWRIFLQKSLVYTTKISLKSL